MKTKGIIVDLDGTLCDSAHRQHFMTQKPKDWKSFYENLAHDPIVPWCQTIIQTMKLYRAIILVSGRPDNYKKETETWLIKNHINYDRLLMRKEGDYRKDFLVKEEIYRRDIEPQFEIEFCIDDRKQVVDLWRRLGLVCLQCAEGDF